MRRLPTCLALMGVVCVATPSIAATNLECIDEGYTPEQEQVFADYYANFAVEPPVQSDQEEAPDPLIDPISSRAVDCTLEYGWSPDAIYHAVTYRMSVMLDQALELNTPFSAEQTESLNKALANADEARLRAILGPGIEASLSGEEDPGMSEEDELYLGLLVMGSGLPMEESTSGYVGSLLGARLMAQIAAEKFAGD